MCVFFFNKYKLSSSANDIFFKVFHKEKAESAVVRNELADDWQTLKSAPPAMKQACYIFTHIIMKKPAFQEKTRKWVKVKEDKSDVCVWEYI